MAGNVTCPQCKGTGGTQTGWGVFERCGLCKGKKKIPADHPAAQ